MSRDTKKYLVLDAKAVAGVGNNIEVDDFMHMILQVWFAAATLTIKAQGSISEDCPDFSAARSLTNQWEYIELVDYESSSNIDGSTGIAVTSNSSCRLLELNVNGLKWINIEVSSVTGGTVSIIARLFNNK